MNFIFTLLFNNLLMIPQQSSEFIDLQKVDNHEEVQLLIKPKMSPTIKKTYLILVICCIITTLLNAYSQLFIHKSEKIQENSIKENSIKDNEQKLINQTISASPVDILKFAFKLDDKVQQRISYGEPREKQHFSRTIVIQKKDSKSPHCILTNVVSVISTQTIQTVFKLLSLPNAQKWIVFIPNVDIVSNNKIKQLSTKLGDSFSIQNYEFTADSNYEFVTNYTHSCQSVIYLQNTFRIDEQNAKALIENANKLETNLKSGYVGYSTTATHVIDPNTSVSLTLTDLKSANLYSLGEQKFNQHIYIFDANLLNLVTPINFIHFNKYTIEQMIINPILVLTQNSAFLVPLDPFTYSFEDVIVNFKEFALKQPEKSKGQTFCIISYPSNPTKNSQDEFTQYLKAISEINSQQFDVTLVPHFVYNFQDKQELIGFYQKIKEFQDKNKKITIRMRTKQFSAVSSLSAYESVHNYCPQSSIVISSRQNIKLHKEILKIVSKNINEKEHYYQLKETAQKENDKTLFPANRFSIEKFISEHSKIQIFKSDIMKMVNIWVLKKSENQFYESEASFIVPILEMSGSNTKIIQVESIASAQRPVTSAEKQEMEILNTFSKWGQMKNNILTPIQFNSLHNLNLRRGSHNEIPKIIHQIWFKDQNIPQSTSKLISTIKTVNKQYEYKLWKKENMTQTHFPLSYRFVARTLEHEWSVNKSYHPWVQALFGYEVLYNQGGIYLDLNVQAIQPFDHFLKYDIFFAGQVLESGEYSSPISFNRQIFAVKKNSYHLRLILTEIINDRRMNFNINDYEAAVGGGAIRTAFTPSQVYTNIGFGFYLMNYDAFGKQRICNIGSCEKTKQSYVQIHLQ